MEKKEIDKRFYFLSAVNLIPAIILGGGMTFDSLSLAGALLVLVINHTVLVSIVKSVTSSASEEGRGSSRQMTRILGLMFLKFCLLFGVVALIYFYKKELITKLFLIIFFQLIIQVVSIKNNYQNS